MCLMTGACWVGPGGPHRIRAVRDKRMCDDAVRLVLIVWQWQDLKWACVMPHYVFD